MSEKQERKPMGRPRLPEGQAKLHALGLRTDLVNYQTVNEWAAQSGTSVAQEIERSIEFRRWFEEMFRRLFEGPLRRPNIAMVSTFEHAGQAAARRRRLPDSKPNTWLPDAQCYQAALAETVMAMLESGPEGFSAESAAALFRVIERRLFVKKHSGFVGSEPEAPAEESPSVRGAKRKTSARASNQRAAGR